ncbi:unnamed protein product [Fusarium graminearum]|nr:unnamed protein product [Fusarium graminearum]
MDTEPPTVFGAHLKKYVNFLALHLDQAILIATARWTMEGMYHDSDLNRRPANILKESSEGVIEIVDFDASLVKAMIYFTYHLNYDVPYGSSAMAFNAGMYQIADKYAMSALKRYAHGEFSISIKECWEDVALPDVISLVYTSTPSSDRGLRDTVVGTSLVHLNILMDRDEFRAELASNADFSIDIIRFQSKRSWGQQHYDCGNCKTAFYMVESDGLDERYRAKHCPRCRVVCY